MWQVTLDFAIALLIGALVGLERERKKAQEQVDGVAGLRTFILIAAAGASAGWLSQAQQSGWVVAVFGLVVAGLVLAAQSMHARRHPESLGLTTEMAAVVVYLLGAAAVTGHRDLAVGMGVATSLVLAYKRPLHSAASWLSEDDLHAILKLLLASFIVLPVLPNRPIDPWALFNPYKVWFLVVLISGLSLLGYLATRLLGSRAGITLTGLFGGLASSTAVTLAFSRDSRGSRGNSPVLLSLTAGLLLAWTVMFARVVIEVAIVYPPLVRGVLVPMGAMGATALVLTALALLRSRRAAAATPDVTLQNPFSLWSATKFALLFLVVSALVTLVQRHYQNAGGFYLVAVLAGLTDVDAITLSMAGYARSGGDAGVAIRAITMAATSNTLVKCGMAVVLGGGLFGRWVAVATVLILLAAALVLLS